MSIYNRTASLLSSSSSEDIDADSSREGFSTVEADFLRLGRTLFFIETPNVGCRRLRGKDVGSIKAAKA